MARTLISEVVGRALAEDVGDGDVTTLATVPETARAQAAITQKAPGVVFGLDARRGDVPRAGPEIELERLVEEGRVARAGAGAARSPGRRARILTGERTALNFLAAAVRGGDDGGPVRRGRRRDRRRILDTRKTTPGLRTLEKAAVAAGGGTNHRAGLYDAILIKENHAAMAGGVGEAVRRGRARAPELPLEVECRTLAEVDEALGAGAPTGSCSTT